MIEKSHRDRGQASMRHRSWGTPFWAVTEEDNRSRIHLIGISPNRSLVFFNKGSSNAMYRMVLPPAPFGGFLLLPIIISSFRGE